MNYQIVFEDNLTSRFAADELQKYMYRICGQFPTKSNLPEEGKTCIYLGSPVWMEQIVGLPDRMNELRYDGFVVSVKKDSIRITGNEPRSISYGVYHLLKSIGCAWVCPGVEGELLPQMKEISFPLCETVVNPVFEIRELLDDMGTAADEQFVAEYMALVEWGYKNGYNTLSANPSKMSVGEMFRHFLKKRDLRCQVGGHNIRLHVDRALFEEKPEMFRMKNGERRKDGNFCSTNPDAIKMFCDGVKNDLSKEPSIGILGIYFDDVFEGAWCDCPNCKEMSAVEQAFSAANQLARSMKQNYPNVKAGFLLYHDTLEMPIPKDPPPSNMMGIFAPRERCYAHAINDPSCENNRRYWANLQKAMKILPNMIIFEYYADEILWNKTASDTPHVIMEDYRAYHSIGVNNMSVLHFHQFSSFAYRLNMWISAQGMWNLDLDIDAASAEFCRVIYRDQADIAMKTYQLREQASKLWLQFCGYQKLADIRDIPPQNEPFMTKHITDMKTCVALWKECIDTLQTAQSKTEDIGVIAQLESDILALTLSIKQMECNIALMSARADYKWHGMKEKDFANEMDRIIEATFEIAKFIQSLPYSLLGADQADRLVNHLCYDQISMYRSLKENASENKNNQQELQLER